MKFSVLASGSRANCTFVDAGSGCCFLIDCGLSARQVEQRLRFIGVEPRSVKAILISHEHRDHIAGAGIFSKRWRVPIYATEATAEFLDQPFAVEHFENGRPFMLDSACIQPFSIPHDAADPAGFVVEAEGLRLGHVTDLGEVTPAIAAALAGCQAVVLESNHDEELLANCWYPWPLKKRIASSHGHLSNRAAGALLAEIAHAALAHVVLAHISENSNTPAVARSCVLERLASTEWAANLAEAGPACPTALLSLAV